MITLYQLNIVIGSFLISIVNNFTQRIKSDASYRIPIGLLLVLPVLIIPGLPFLPESPRRFIFPLGFIVVTNDW